MNDTIFQNDTIFTLEEAFKRIREGNFEIGDEFGLPDVYGKDWTIQRGPAGVFGKKFFNLINAYPDLGIKFKDMGKYGRRAVYKIGKKTTNYIQKKETEGKHMSNKQIRRAIKNYIKHFGMQDTRIVIDKFSKAFYTTKQRISGNISYMKCIDRSINIISNKPHSKMY
ncbi:hypothetical protein ACFQWC_00215 [Rossellomorea sp. GCM10028870]